MKKIFLFLVFSFVILVNLNAKPDFRKEWQEANGAYTAGDYLKASQLYSLMINEKWQSVDVYYNIANCYYKMDNLAKAILYYNRALLLDPSNEDIQHNLRIAETQTTNRIEKLPDFFVVRWIDSLNRIMSSNAWAGLSIFVFALIFVSFIMFFFSRKVWLRKTFFSMSLVAVVVFIVSVLFATNQKNKITNSNTAIVMKNSVAVKSSPSDGGTDLFVLNEGAKINVRETLGEWSEVVIESGNTGWLNNSVIEYIKPQ